MKTPPSDPASRWEQLVRRAQSDVGPPTDLPALLHAVNKTRLPARESWCREFVDLFGTRRAIPTCFAGAATIAVLTTWQIWTFWQALPWAQLLAISPGGAQ